MQIQKLKDLTPQQCIEIASIVRQKVSWKFVEAKENYYYGFDLIEEGVDTYKAKYVFQIDWRDYDEMLKVPIGMKPTSRFRIYKHLRELPINEEARKEIDDYLVMINLRN